MAKLIAGFIKRRATNNSMQLRLKRKNLKFQELLEDEVLVIQKKTKFGVVILYLKTSLVLFLSEEPTKTSRYSQQVLVSTPSCATENSTTSMSSLSR